MKTFLASFSYNNDFYELFNNNGKIDIIKIGKNKEVNEQDRNLCKLVVLNLIKSSRLDYSKVNYNGSTFKIIYNDLTGTFEFRKIVDGKYVPCTKKEYDFLNNKYNNPVYDYSYNHNDFNSFGSSYGYGYDPYSYEREQKRKREARRKRIITIGASAVLTVSISVTGMLGYINGWFSKDKAEELPPLPGIETSVDPSPLIEEPEIGDITYIDGTFSEETIEKEIREALKGEPDWVIEETVETVLFEYRIINGLPFEEEIKETPVLEESSPRVQEILSILKNNNNFTEQEKDTLISNYIEFFENYLKYFDDNSFEKACNTIATMTVDRSQISTGGIQDNQGVDVGGRYYDKENKIALYAPMDTVLTHEFMHSLGAFDVISSNSNHDLISEGYTELLNPLGSGSTYKKEQTVGIILSEIYGKDFMLDAYYSSSLPFKLIMNEDTRNDWNIIQSINDDLEAIRPYSIDEVISNPKYKGVLDSMIGKLKQLYESRTNESWEENEIIKACLDILYKTNKLGLDNDIFISHIGFSKDGSIVIEKSKPVDVSYHESEYSYSELHFNATSTEEIGRGR